jgi:predicted helicase
MPRRYRLRFVYEKKNCSVSIDTLHDKTHIIYNSHLTIENIPLKAYEYIVNGKSALDWIMERYAVTIDKASQIKNDPNDWSREHEQPRYILDLLLSVMILSCQTVNVVSTLPKLKI